ncbi:MAG TPA: preprotein translocase subunit SecE [Saprospiraceae bacterium]|nr:preprotein translocase subunit SecE [Saprospiraceae bacterium]
MESLRLYIKESIDELVNNVTWPTWSELIQSTGLVLIASTIFAIVIFLMDSASNFGLGLIYQ